MRSLWAMRLTTLQIVMKKAETVTSCHVFWSRLDGRMGYEGMKRNDVMGYEGKRNDVMGQTRCAAQLPEFEL